GRLRAGQLVPDAHRRGAFTCRRSASNGAPRRDPGGAMSDTKAVARAAAEEPSKTQPRANPHPATPTIPAKRAAAVSELPDWEELREAGRAIKQHVLEHLDRYLLEFEQALTAAGGHVHWARDAAEANAIVARVVKAARADEAVKVKSLTT